MQRVRQLPTLRLTGTLVLSAWLAGCAINTDQPSVSQHARPVPAHYAGWFTSGPDADIDGSDWGSINRAQDRIDEERYDEAIAYLQPLMHFYIPPAFYEMAKLYEHGLGVDQDPAEAARLYGEALNKPSSIRGHASLNLAKLYREGRGVNRNDVLAYHLLWQAKEANLDRTAEVELAELLSEGGEGVEADPALARELYEQAASQNKAQALSALAEAHAPGGWLEEDAAKSRAHAQHYAKQLEAKAEMGDVGAMLQLASLYSPDGLLGDQPAQRIRWLTLAADAGDIDALARVGHEMTQMGNYRQGITVLEDAARQGHVEAMTYLGQALLSTENADQPDPVRAERWLREAIQADSDDARVILGRALVEGQAGLDDLPRGMDLLEKAAERNHPLALAQLGSLLMDDERVESQPVIAARYLKRSHELGHPWATHQLGAAYLTGRGVTQDPQRAEELLQNAVDLNQTGAMRLLGEAYLKGDVLHPQPRRGEELLAQAADQGDTTAMTLLGEAYLDGTLEGNPREGIHLLTQAAQQDDGYAMIVLGRVYREGIGVKRDLNEANHWLTRAQEAGHASADDALTYVQRDLGAEGNIDALIAAAKGGHPGAMADLGRAYLDGKGIERNQSQAENWLKRAHRAGHAGAGASLGRLYLDRGNSESGIDYLSTAAARGHAGASTDLGEAYLTGNHVEQDVVRGFELLTTAAESGVPHAAFMLGDAYQHGNGVAKDAVPAERWYQQASDGGAVYAQTALGIAYMRGEGAIVQDVQRGHELLMDAAEQGHAGAQASLGREYLRGENIEKDPERGVNYLYEAASQGHRSARLALAGAYLSARGHENPNQEQAMLWLDNLIDNEGQMAIETLHQLLIEEAAFAAVDEMKATSQE
ncbi:SEL1-like repeat protein [Halomonas salinarum]|uniref:SEL1-like repeat protein n=1 Tax=Halomonas salinarum TaxID=1158993 RepID=UPI001FD8704A|nr:tetratricopeptide repeat protein [Halomonas salinarum]